MMKPITFIATAMALLLASFGFAQSPTFTITPSPTTAAINDIKTFDVKVTNFTNLITAQFAIRWKTNLMTYEAASVTNIAALAGLNYGAATSTIQDGSASTGQIKVAWGDLSGAGQSLANGTTLFSFKLKAIANGLDTVKFGKLTGPPGSIEIVNSNGNDLTTATTFTGAIITIGTVPPPPNGPALPPSFTGFGLINSHETVAPGAEFEMSVTTQDFNNITSMEYTTTFDPAKLQYIKTTSHNTALTGIDVLGGNFFLNGPGKLKFTWSDVNAAANGITLPNGTVIYKIKFKNLMADAQFATVDYMTGQFQTEVLKSINNQTSAVTWHSAYGIVSSKTPTQTLSDLVFYMDTVTVNAATEACLKIKANAFTDIEQISYTHEWDKTKLTFSKVKLPTPVPLTGMTVAANFNNLPTTGNTGILNVIWTEPSAGKVTVPRGTVLYEVCYNTAVASVGDNVVKFDSTQTVAQEIMQDQAGVSKVILVTFKNGLIKVTNIPPPTVCDPIVLGSQQTNAKCSGGNEGTIDLIVTPASQTAATYTYAWTGPTFTSQIQDISNLKAGVYQVTVTCLAQSSTRSVTITEPAPLALTQTAITQVSCFGGSDGGISITTSGGTSPFTYKWTGPNGFASTSKNISGRPCGSYSVSITDANNCTFQSSPISVPCPSAALSIPSPNITQVNINCFGASTGSITISNAAGGTAPFSYAWSGPNGYIAQGSAITGLAIGSYTVTVSDSKSCTFVNSVIIIDGPATAVSVATDAAGTKNVKCFGGADGKACVTASGGTAPYSYSWFNGTNTGQCVDNLVAGTYQCIVIDAKGCSKSHSVTVGQPTSGMEIVSAQVENVKCFGQSNGKITVNISAGGTAPYVYAFSAGTVSGNMASNLAAGNYTFTVTDASGCTDSDARQISQPTELALATQVTNQVGATLGSVNLTVAGGTSPFSFNWSNGTTGEDLPQVPAGTYTVTVTDANGCSKTTSATVINDSKLQITLKATKIECSGEKNGQMEVTMVDGQPAYLITWTDNLGATNSVTTTQNPHTITGLPGGPVMVTVTDNTGSTDAETAFVNQNAGFSTKAPSNSPTIGGGFTDGKVSFIVKGGSPFPGNPKYLFAWTFNGTAVAAGQITTKLDTSTVKGLDEGKWCVTATDAAGCTVSECGDLVRQYLPMAIVDAMTPPNCQDSLQGAINITASGGDEVYTYKWTGPNAFVSTNEDLTKLVEGFYTLIVTDSRGTSITKSYTLTALSHLGATVASGSTCGIYDICNAEICDGAGSVTYQSNFGNVQFLWSNGETSQTATALCDGLSTVLVSDAAGCKVSLELNLSAPASIVSTQVVNRQVTCFGDCDGSAQVTAIGGILPHTFLWSNGETGQVATKLCGGENFVTIMDAEGISKVEKITLDSPDSLKVTLELTQLPTDFETCDGIVTAVIMGGPVGAVPIYAWNIPNEFDAVAENLCTGDPIFVSIKVGECTAQAELNRVPPPADGCAVGVPVITPGIQDSKNDLFIITCSEVLPNNHLEIYNRWGQLVFETDDYQSNWDGTFFGNGKKLAEGVYFWLFTYEGTNGDPIQEKGYVTLLRGDDE